MEKNKYESKSEYLDYNGRKHELAFIEPVYRSKLILDKRLISNTMGFFFQLNVIQTFAICLHLFFLPVSRTK